MKVLAVTEQRDGALRKVSHEVIAAARSLADQSGGSVDAVVLGAGAVAGLDQLGSFGADQVLHGTHADFALYSPDGASATIASIGAGYGAIVLAATAMGRDLAPRVAARLGVSCATDVTALGVEGNVVTVTRPIYAGKVLQHGKAHRHDGGGVGSPEHLPSGCERQGGNRLCARSTGVHRSCGIQGRQEA